MSVLWREKSGVRIGLVVEESVDRWGEVGNLEWGGIWWDFGFGER